MNVNKICAMTLLIGSMGLVGGMAAATPTTKTTKPIAPAPAKPFVSGATTSSCKFPTSNPFANFNKAVKALKEVTGPNIDFTANELSGTEISILTGDKKKPTKKTTVAAEAQALTRDNKNKLSGCLNNTAELYNFSVGAKYKVKTAEASKSKSDISVAERTALVELLASEA